MENEEIKTEEQTPAEQYQSALTELEKKTAEQIASIEGEIQDLEANLKEFTQETSDNSNDSNPYYDQDPYNYRDDNIKSLNMIIAEKRKEQEKIRQTLEEEKAKLVQQIEEAEGIAAAEREREAQQEKDLQQATEQYSAQFREARNLIAKLKENEYFRQLYDDERQESREYEERLKDIRQKVIEGTANPSERDYLISSEVFQDISYTTRALKKAQKKLKNLQNISQDQQEVLEAIEDFEKLEATKKKISNKRQPLHKKVESENQGLRTQQEVSIIEQPETIEEPTEEVVLQQKVQPPVSKKQSIEQLKQQLKSESESSVVIARLESIRRKIADSQLGSNDGLKEEMEKLLAMDKKRNEYIEELANIIYNGQNSKKTRTRKSQLRTLIKNNSHNSSQYQSQIASIEKAIDEAKKVVAEETKEKEKQSVKAAQPQEEKQSIFDKIKERFSSKKTYKVTNRRKPNNLNKLKIKIAAAATTVALLITGIVGINVASKNSNPSPDDVYPTEEYVQENSDTDTHDTDIFDTDIAREVDTDDQAKEESTDEEKEEEDKKEETPDSNTKHDKEQEEPGYYRFTVAIQEGAPIYDDMYDAKNETSPYSRYFSDDTKRYAETIVWEDSNGQLNNTEASQWKDQGRIVAVSTSVESSQDIKGRVERTEGFFSINDVTIYDQELNPISIGGGMRR